MKLKEALKVLGNTTIHHIDSCGNITNNKLSDSNEYKLIEKSLTPPTSDDVCKALSEELEDDVIFFNGDFVAVGKGRVVISKFSNGEILTQVSFAPHLITLIGRFYEGLGE